MIDVDDVTTSLNQGGGGKRAGTPGAGKKRVALGVARDLVLLFVQP